MWSDLPNFSVLLQNIHSIDAFNEASREMQSNQTSLSLTRYYLQTAISRMLFAFIRQRKSQLHPQHGVARKEARCPNKQGEVSYSTFYCLSKNILVGYISLSMSKFMGFPTCTLAKFKSQTAAKKVIISTPLALVSWLT